MYGYMYGWLQAIGQGRSSAGQARAGSHVALPALPPPGHLRTYGHPSQAAAPRPPPAAPILQLPTVNQPDVLPQVMYEPLHAELVAAVIKHRLAPAGRALLACAVRQLAVFQHFAAQCGARGLRYRRRQLDAAGLVTQSAFEGILGRAEEYEGERAGVDGVGVCGRWERGGGGAAWLAAARAGGQAAGGRVLSSCP